VGGHGNNEQKVGSIFKALRFALCTKQKQTTNKKQAVDFHILRFALCALRSAKTNIILIFTFN